MPQLGKAFVEVRADLSKFPAELRTKLKAAFKEGVAGVDFKDLEDKAAKGGEEAAHRAGEGFKSRGKSEFKKAGEEGGKALSGGLFATVRRLFSGGSQRSGFLGSIGELFGSIKGEVNQGLSGIQNTVGQAGGALGGLFGGGGDITGALKVGAIVAAVPAVFALAGALVHLSGILLAIPAAAGVAGAAIAPLVIGFQGFGEAVGAGLSGDTKKFNESLKSLAPAAKSVAKEFVGFKGQFDSLRKSVQQSLFAPLVGEIKPLLKTLLPVLSTGLKTVAGSFGQFFRGFTEILRSSEAVKGIQALFQTTGRIVSGFAPVLLGLFTSLGRVTAAGLPFVEKIFAGLGSGIQEFSGWLDKITKNGQFQTFLQNAIDIGGQLIDTVKSLGPLIGAIFGGQDVKEGSQGFLKDIQTAIEDLTDFFKSPDGKQFIAVMVQAVKFLGDAVILTVHAFAGLIEFANDAAKFLFDAFNSVVDFFSGVGSGIEDAASSIGDFFGGVIDSIVGFFTDTLPAAFDEVVSFFTSLPDRILEGIGQVIGVILGLPYFIGQAFDSIVDFLFSLPDKVTSALSSLGDLIGGFFRDGFEAAKSFVSSGIDAIGEFIGSIPGRIKAIGPMLLDAARSLGHKIGDGFSEIGNFASDIGSRIVSTIKSGINRIVDGINRGIADIDDKIPISLPRLPHFERGGIIDSPTVALLGEKGKREVVLPLTNPGRAQELANQSGLTDILAKSNGGGTTVNLTAVLDGFGVMKVVQMTVDEALDTQGSELAFGPRT